MSIEEIKHAIRFDFTRLRELVPAAFTRLSEPGKQLTLDECSELRWVVKGSCYLYDQVPLRIQIRDMIQKTFSSITESSFDNKLTFDQAQATLHAASYYATISLSTEIEGIQTGHFESLRKLWNENPGDLLIGRLFAKCLLALQTFLGFNNIFMFLIEDRDSRRDYEEA